MMAHKRSMERNSAPATDPLQQPTEGGGEQDGSQVAQEHGPAVEVNVMHEHEAGQHHVHSKHPDGHEHHSDHGSADEAHEHAKKLAGAGVEEEQPQDGDAPEYE
jgi:hypothetical protein